MIFHFLPISLSFIFAGTLTRDVVWLRALMLFGNIIFLLYAFLELKNDVIPVIIFETFIVMFHLYHLVDLIILKQINETKKQIDKKNMIQPNTELSANV